MVENFAGGTAAGAAPLREAEARVGCPVTEISSSLLAAHDGLFGGRQARIALLTPFMPVGDAAARALFEGAGHAVLAVTGLRAPSPAAIAALPTAALRQAVHDLAHTRPDAILQLGTNLPFAALAEAATATATATATAELALPVLASNPIAYWRALRRAGIADPLPGSLSKLG